MDYWYEDSVAQYLLKSLSGVCLKIGHVKLLRERSQPKDD